MTKQNYSKPSIEKLQVLKNLLVVFGQVNLEMYLVDALFSKL